MRHRIPQQLLTIGVIGLSPLALITDGLVAPQNRFMVAQVEKHGSATVGVTYEWTYKVVTAAKDAEIVPGEYVDDLAVLSGDSTP